jgi:hypothetical protein
VEELDIILGQLCVNARCRDWHPEACFLSA